MPIIMLRLMRMPTSIPEPAESRLQLTPTFISAPVPPSGNSSGMRYQTSAMRRASARNPITSAEAMPPKAIERAAPRDSGPRESSTISVSPAATPSANVSFSSTTKCWRIGTDSSTPRMPAVVSHANDWTGVSAKLKCASGSIRSRSNAAISTHRNAVCPAEVPAVWTMLFSQRLKSRNTRPSAR